MTKADLRRIQRFLTRTRNDLGDMSIQRLQTLLQVYLSEEIDQSSLIATADLSKSATSKHIASWTKLTATKTRGPGFVRSEPDPMNLKTRIIHITKEGKDALDSILSAIN